MSSRFSSDPPPKEDGRICEICSDRANGYNFGVLSCESCKAFFRRTASKKNSISCPFSKNCEITSASRRFCQACRLQKCFSKGMTSDGLETIVKPKKRKKEYESEDDEETVSISKAALKNLMKKANQANPQCVCMCICGFYPPGTKLTAEEKHCSTEMSPASSYPPTPSSSCYRSPLTPTFVRPAMVEQFVPPVFDGFKPTTVIEHTPFSAFHSPLSFNLPTSVQPRMDIEPFDIEKKLATYILMNEEEKQLMRELYIKNEPLKAPLEKNYSYDNLNEVVRIAEEAIRRIIRVVASLDAFQQLKYEDKKLLVKDGFCELLIVRGIMAYDRKKDTWTHGFATNKMELKLDVLKQNGSETKHYEIHKRLIESFKDEIRNNYNIMLIFNAIIIFRPGHPNLIEKDKICSIQSKYFALLLKVLEHEFNTDQAQRLYRHLLDMVVDLHCVNESMLKVFYGFDPNQLDPLIKELCDM